MKFGVVIFPGSNCYRDLIHVVKNNMKKEVVELWHKDHNLQGCDFILLPGGFSYGDYLRSESRERTRRSGVWRIRRVPSQMPGSEPASSLTSSAQSTEPRLA